MVGTLKGRVGSSWIPIAGSGQEAANLARWNSSWGRQATALLTSDSTGIGNSPGRDIMTANNVLMTAGRRYRLHAEGWVQRDASDGTSVAVLYLDVVTVQQTNFTTYSNQAIYWATTVDYDATSTASHTVAANLYTTTGTIGAAAGPGRPSILYIDDIGPITPVSIAPPTAGPRVVASGNALGVVAIGSMVTAEAPRTFAANTVADLTTRMSFTSIVGRRYRMKVFVRVIQCTTGEANINLFPYGSGIGGTGADSWTRLNQGAYTFAYSEVIFDGTGVASSYYWTVNPTDTTNAWLDGLSNFYIEDVGPNTSPALPIPATPPAWTPLTPVSGWSNVGAGAAPLSYRKIGDVVQLRGELNYNIGANPFATLPVGFRPAYGQTFNGVVRISPYPSIAIAVGADGTIGAYGLSSAVDFGIGTISFSVTP
jgi:hypothetical protein